MTATTPASVQSTREAAKVCRRQAMRPPMTTRRRGCPRREDPEDTTASSVNARPRERPRRPLPLEVSPPGARACPGRAICVREVGAIAHSRVHPYGRRVCGDARRRARHLAWKARRARVQRSRRTEGTSPALPTVPGARTRPTSGPSTHARCRSVHGACQAFAVAHTSTIPPCPRIFKRRRALWIAELHAKAPVDKCSGRASVWITPPATLVSVPNPDRDSCTKCKNGPYA